MNDKEDSCKMILERARTLLGKATYELMIAIKLCDDIYEAAELVTVLNEIEASIRRLEKSPKISKKF